jgi:hypothetical protein
MLTPSQIASADEYVKFFYSELAKTPRNFNGESLEQVAYKYYDCYDALELEPHQARLLEYKSKEQYESFLRKLSPRKREIVHACEKIAAIYGGVDKLGIDRLIRRVPVLVYQLSDGEWEQGNYHAVGNYELGLNSQSLYSWAYCHDWKSGVAIHWHGSGVFKKSIEDIDIVCHLYRRFRKQIRNNYTGLLYQSFQKDGEETSFLLVDTTAGTQSIETEERVKAQSLEMKARYGIDRMYLLSATNQINITARNDPRDDCTKVYQNYRLDACDGEYVNLNIKEFGQIMNQYESDTLFRILLLSAKSKGGFSSSDPDPSQTFRDVFLEHAYMMANIRASRR